MKMTSLKRRKLAALNQQIVGTQGVGCNDFADYIRSQYEYGANFRQISQCLRDRYGIEMSQSTVRNWYKLLIGEPRKQGGYER